ncbi:hypothetical protein BDP27DRAFT_1330389 [Rhodocollybia butyracea]|uniref:Uncharacterized protein n=1 Tax=Rhodocollybia butyracea TaxID=206335 RepID=A0A9P5PNS1_9AGAR|nr:hypothetical protein BDP27DRAFT_1330389 [Rhodocollybia butyracea]
MQRNSAQPQAATTLSVDSFFSGNATVSSASTFRGLGSLTGKAILNVGKMTVKGIEQIIISRRLSVMAKYFPHRAGDKVPGLTEMYMDLLELSRPELYPESIRVRALQMLLAQIASRSIEKLVEVLSDWPVVELRLVIRDVTSRIDPIRQVNIQDPIVLEYQRNLANGESHSLAPFVDFLSTLNSSNSQAFSEILSAGVEELLVHLYISDFRDQIASSGYNKTAFSQRSILAFACDQLLLEACSDPSSYEQLEHCPIHGLWSLSPMLPFGKMEVDRCSQRREWWGTLGLREIQWRISSAFDVLVDWGRSLTEVFSFDLLIDLLEFSGSTELPDPTSFRALRSLHRFFIRSGDRAVRGLRMYLDQTPLDHAQDVFSCIIQRLLLLSLQDPAADSFYKFCCPHSTVACHLRGKAALHLIQRFSQSAQSNDTLYQVLIQADIAGLLSSASTAVEYPDGTTQQDWSSYALLWEKQPPVPSEELNYINEASGDLLTKVIFSSNRVSNPATYRTEVLALAWKLFFRPDPKADILFPSLHHEAWGSIELEPSDRDHVYLWIK